MDRILSLRIRNFQEKIIKWFDVEGRVFQWRASDLDPYEIIISEILLQRTKAQTVSNFYGEFLVKFPNWEALADADIHRIELYLKPIGLQKQRSKRIADLAKYMVKNNNKLPKQRKTLEAIPFMGQYIANAVELLIYDRKKPLLDVNMARVLERYFGPRMLKDIRYDPYLQNLALRVVDHPMSKQINWGILDFAALICKVTKPFCEVCMFQLTCKYYQTSMEHQLNHK